MSLIAVSPRKLGTAATDGLIPEKFQSKSLPGNSFWFLDFFNGVFFLNANNGANRFYHAADPSVTLGGIIGNLANYTTQTIISSGDGTLMYINTSGTMFMSYNLGATWGSQKTSTGNGTITNRMTAAVGPVWAVQGESGTVCERSADNGVTFVKRITPINVGNIAFGLGKFVVARGKDIYSCSDGIATAIIATSWRKSTSVFAGTIPTALGVVTRLYPRVQFLIDRFFIFEQPGLLLYSFDGDNWLETTFPAIGGIAKIIYQSGMWLGLCPGSNSYIYSLDGIEWRTALYPNGFAPYFAAAGNDMFMFAAQDGNYLTYKIE